MGAGRVSESESDAIVAELGVSLLDMLDRTCADMVPLWLDATRKARSDGLREHAVPGLGFVPGERYFRLGKGSQAKYRTLAAWRHAMLWRRPAIEDADFRRAVDALYFTPFPDNVPPYAWSHSAAKAPGVGKFPSATTLKAWAKEGCAVGVAALRRDRESLRAGPSGLADEFRADLLRAATHASVEDVLKLEEMKLKREEK